MSLAPAPEGKKKRRKREDDLHNRTGLQKPPNQEKLAPQELQEDIVRTLTTYVALKPKNLIVWNFKESSFTVAEDESTFIPLFSMASELVNPSERRPEGGGGGNEADHEPTHHFDDLVEEVSDKEEIEIKKVESVTTEGVKEPEVPMKAGTVIKSKMEVKEEEVEEPDDEKEEGASSETHGQGGKKLLNQFNFCERSIQTHMQKQRDHNVQTDNPIRSHYRDACNQWIIFDAYKEDATTRPAADTARPGKDEEGMEPESQDQDPEDAENKKAEKLKSAKKEDVKVKERPLVKMRKASYLGDGHQGSGDQIVLLKAVDGLRFMEGLVGSNTFEDVIDDFKYYEDGADEYREISEHIYGTLLPLWKFNFEKAKRMHVTSISWSQSHPDMFAVTFGSFHFTHPVRNGLVLIYTLRNTTYPEFVWSAPKGAMSSDIHPQRNCLVAIGLYDGNVGVLNLEKDEQNKSQTDILRNTPTVLKHGSAVWTVKWGSDDFDGNPTFYSAGMDGKFIQWTFGLTNSQKSGGLVGNELAMFYLPREPIPGPDGTCYKLFGCVRVVAFHPRKKLIFLVGTVEGKILKCSVNYASKFQAIFDAHYLPVAGLEWNHFHNDIFISCSEDWTIKIWDTSSTSPMYVFEVGVGILDVCWAPYSSTIFAATSDDGKVLVYDLAINKERPVCSQQVVTKKRVHPHRIKFNPTYPILIVGDDKSGIQTLKLSPNLRMKPKDARNIFYLEGEARVQFEIEKIKKLLILVRDPEISKIEADEIKNRSLDDKLKV